MQLPEHDTYTLHLRILYAHIGFISTPGLISQFHPYKVPNNIVTGNKKQQICSIDIPYDLTHPRSQAQTFLCKTAYVTDSHPEQPRCQKHR
jgi:hypothetical protein